MTRMRMMITPNRTTYTAATTTSMVAVVFIVTALTVPHNAVAFTTTTANAPYHRPLVTSKQNIGWKWRTTSNSNYGSVIDPTTTSSLFGCFNSNNKDTTSTSKFCTSGRNGRRRSKRHRHRHPKRLINTIVSYRNHNSFVNYDMEQDLFDKLLGMRMYSSKKTLCVCVRVCLCVY